MKHKIMVDKLMNLCIIFIPLFFPTAYLLDAFNYQHNTPIRTVVFFLGIVYIVALFLDLSKLPKRYVTARIMLFCVCLIELLCVVALLLLHRIAFGAFEVVLLCMLLLYTLVSAAYCIQHKNDETWKIIFKGQQTNTEATTDDGVQRFTDHRVEFQALQEVLNGLSVTKIGKGLPASTAMQEAAGWQICSGETLSDDALAQLGEALKPLTGVLYGVSVQTPFTYFIVSPATIEGRVCVSYSPDGTEPTQFVRDLRPIEPHWFALRFG